MKDLIIVRGGGDLATGSIYKLKKSGFPVLILEVAKPSAIRRNVARLLDLPLDHVAFKATTEEKLGFTGELKGLKAVALVSAVR